MSTSPLLGDLPYPEFAISAAAKDDVLLLVVGETVIENVFSFLNNEDLQKTVDKIHELPMWKGDRYFLPLVFDDDPKMFHGYMPYKGSEPLSWSFVRI